MNCGCREDRLRRAVAPPPSPPGRWQGRKRGWGRTMGCGADSNSQFLVASSPPRLELAVGRKAEEARFSSLLSACF